MIGRLRRSLAEEKLLHRPIVGDIMAVAAVLGGALVKLSAARPVFLRSVVSTSTPGTGTKRTWNDALTGGASSEPFRGRRRPPSSPLRWSRSARSVVAPAR
jgi:hypothetical protein